MHHAWHNGLAFFDIDSHTEPPKGPCIGPNKACNLLKLLYLELADDDLIIHAMPLRPVFQRYLTGEDQ